MKRIDAKGKACPLPVILAKRAAEEGEGPFLIEVDNETAVWNLQKLAKTLGWQITEAAPFQLLFEKAGAPGEAGAAARAAGLPGTFAQENALSAAPVFFAAGETLGSGNDALGATLMELFFYALTEGEVPRGIVLMNGGVRLAAQNAQTAQHLHALNQKGCAVLVCGTCLDFYGLTAAVPAGWVSNMFEITQFLSAAPRVIRL